MALALIADPKSAASRSLGIGDEAKHRAIVTIIQEDLLGVDLDDLDL